MPEKILGISGLNWAYLGAALAYFLAGTGSALGISIAGRMGFGVLSEEPGRFGSVLVLTLLPGTQGFYGLIIGVLAFFTKATPTMDPLTGFQVFVAALPVGIAGLFSAIYQGMVCGR